MSAGLVVSDSFIDHINKFDVNEINVKGNFQYFCNIYFFHISQENTDKSGIMK